MRILAFWGSLLVLTACGDSRELSYVPPQLGTIKEDVVRCMQDVQWTHAERSEHCVLAAEAYLGSARKECEASQSVDCLSYELVRTDIYSGYRAAIIQSLLEHGSSKEMATIAGKGLWHLTYLDGEAMRALFEQCLTAEERELKAAGLVKVREVVDRPLAEGQRCFRKDYPEFRTKKAVVS